MQLRPGRLEDAENLAALAIQVWLHTYATEGISSPIAAYVLAEFTVAKFATRLAEESCAVILAEIGEHLVGYAICEAGTSCPVPSTAKVELSTLYVQAHFAGRGVGSALLQEAQRWAKQRADSALWLTVNARNWQARTFYAKHGYTAAGISYFKLGHEEHENLVLLGRQAEV